MSCIEPALPSAVRFETALTAAARTSQSRGRDMVARLAQLMARKVDVLVRLVAGKNSRAIVPDLGISVKTVECHRARIIDAHVSERFDALAATAGAP